MGKLLTVLAGEYARVVKKKSFLVGIIITPLILIMFSLLPTLLINRGMSAPVRYAVIDADGRGLGVEFAESLGRYRLDSDSTVPAYTLAGMYAVPDADRLTIDSLRVNLDSMLMSKRLKHYIVIYPRPEDADSIIMVSKSTSFRTSARFDRRMSDILSRKRLERSDVNLPVDSVLSLARRMEMIQMSPGGKSRNFLIIYLSGFAFIMIIFMSVITFGPILMRSVIEEKNSRITEVLVSSVSPFQLMMGKVIGLGAANLTQMVIWLAIGLVLFSQRGALAIPAEITGTIFNPVFIVFFVLFLAIGYFMFATVFAFIGAICNTDQEAQNFIFPIVISLMLPVILMTYFVQEPDSTVTTILSLIPFLTPTMMVMRLNIMAPGSFALADPVVSEAVMGVIISALFTVFLVWVTARVFRVGILMYGKRATLPEILKWVRYP